MLIFVSINSPLILQIRSLLRLLQELLKIKRHFPLERVSYQLVIFIYHFHDFTVQIPEELTDRRCQHRRLLRARILNYRPHALNQFPEIGHLQFVRAIVGALVKNVLVDLSHDLRSFQVLNLRRVINQVKPPIVVFNEILNFLTQIKHGILIREYRIFVIYIALSYFRL